MLEKQINAIITVYEDATKAEISDAWKCDVIGWFQDEVSAIGAISERVLILSAISPHMRKLPALNVRCEYRKMKSGRLVQKFSRGTTVTFHDSGRRVVMLPGLAGKTWIPLPDY